LTILLLSLLPIAGFALFVFRDGNPAHTARTPTTRVPRGITCPQGSPRGRDRILGRDAMKLIIPIGTMCCLIFILARIPLILAIPGFPPEFLQWLAQSGPKEWFFMAIGAGHAGRARLQPEERALRRPVPAAGRGCGLIFLSVADRGRRAWPPRRRSRVR